MYYFVMKITTRAHGDIPLMTIGYKCKYWKLLGFIGNQGNGSTDRGDIYLSSLPYIDSNVSIHPVVCPCIIGIYFDSCNVIFNHNKMWQYDP